MEFAAYLIIGIFFTILFGYLSYKIWLIAFDTIFGTLNKRMIITSKLLGILWPITLPILIIVTFVYLLK